MIQSTRSVRPLLLRLCSLRNVSQGGGRFSVGPTQQGFIKANRRRPFASHTFCYCSSDKGHYAKDCKHSKLTCTFCNRVGHVSRRVVKKNIVERMVLWGGFILLCWIFGGSGTQGVPPCCKIALGLRVLEVFGVVALISAAVADRVGSGRSTLEKPRRIRCCIRPILLLHFDCFCEGRRSGERSNMNDLVLCIIISHGTEDLQLILL